jgi:hypothetical protein
MAAAAASATTNAHLCGEVEARQAIATMAIRRSSSQRGEFTSLIQPWSDGIALTSVMTHSAIATGAIATASPPRSRCDDECAARQRYRQSAMRGRDYAKAAVGFERHAGKCIDDHHARQLYRVSKTMSPAGQGKGATKKKASAKRP